MLERLSRPGKVRYAVVGQGYISQVAVLPAFANATGNSQLAALVSGDPAKLRKLGRKYKVKNLCSYVQYDDLLHSGDIDAVYIALPNSMHREYTIRAARAGVHVLCEKPMAVTEDDCRDMIRACEENSVRLMIAYRLHFEEANLKAIELVRSGKLGEPRIFESQFCMQVKKGNVRVQRELGGGSLYDIGIYCINAARYLFRSEPEEVFALATKGHDDRFREVDEMCSALMRFPGERLACFTTSLGAADVSAYRLTGTAGDLRVDQAYEMVADITHELTVKGKSRRKTFRKRDQFAPELIYFSQCVLGGEDPEPSGWEGLADVRIIQALYDSAATGRPVRLEPFERRTRPDPGMEIKKPAVREPHLVAAEAPSRKE